MRQTNLELRFVRKQIRLFERSVVNAPMNTLAEIETVKSLDLDRQRHSAARCSVSHGAYG